MHTQLIPGTNTAILELVGPVASLQHALDIVSASHEHHSDKVLLRAGQLPPEFFELQTRFAGEFIQKLVNHRLYVAGVFEEEEKFSERVREYVAEARRGLQFRSFPAEGEAIAWLDKQ